MSRIAYRSSRRFAAIAAIGLVFAGGLAGCGKQGALERPAPLFGSRARAQYEAERAQEARDDAQRDAQSTNGTTSRGTDNPPRSTRDMLDPNQRLEPASQAPTPGAPNPFGNAASPVPGR